MNPLIIVALISFFVGMFGYVLVVFWVRPVAAYSKLKRNLAKDLKTTQSLPGQNGSPLYSHETLKALKPVWKKHAAAVSSVYEEKLPDWYKMVLKRRGESPPDAAKHLLALGNMQDPQHAAKRMAQIKDSLKMK
jgi:hypothetical protein